MCVHKRCQTKQLGLSQKRKHHNIVRKVFNLFRIDLGIAPRYQHRCRLGKQPYLAPCLLLGLAGDGTGVHNREVCVFMAIENGMSGLCEGFGYGFALALIDAAA